MADLIPLATARQGGKPALKHKVDGEWVEVSYRGARGRAAGAAGVRGADHDQGRVLLFGEIM